MLEGKTAREAAACADNHMRAADPTGSRALTLEVFSRWCASLVMNKARQHLRFKMGLQTEGELALVLVVGLDQEAGIQSCRSFWFPCAPCCNPSHPQRTTPRQTEDLRTAFIAFASFGGREVAADMDGKGFIKMIRDTGVLGGALTVTEVDLIFAKVRGCGF